MSAPTDAKKLDLILIIAEEFAQRILVGLIQTDHPISFVERKSQRRQRGSRRGIGLGKSSERNIVVDQVFPFDFQVKSSRANFITSDILFKFRIGDIDRLGHF